MGITSGYKISTGTDLGAIFAPIQSGWTAASASGFKLSTGSDLNTAFASLAYGNTSSASATGFNISTGADLNTIFAAYAGVVSGGGNYTGTSLTYTWNLSVAAVSPGANHAISSYHWSGVVASGSGTWSFSSTSINNPNFTITVSSGGGLAVNITCAVTFTNAQVLNVTTSCGLTNTP